MTDSRFSLRDTVGLAAALLVTFVALGHAAAPMFWRVSTQEEFLRGEVDQVSVDADGQLVLGPSTELVYETTAPFLWSVTRVGQSIWIGSGSDGKVFRVAHDGTTTTVYDAAEQNVHAVASLGADAAYVGTSPDGAVLRVTPDAAETVFDPDEKYIWAIAVADDGTVFVATGDRGRIYQIAADGESTLFYDTEATHVLALAFDPDGNVLASTSAPGQVFRITRDGRAFVVLDSPFHEVRALRSTAAGTLYAVAVGQSPDQAQPSPTPAPSSSPVVPTVSTTTTITAVVVADATPTSQPTPQPSGGERQAQAGQGAVYRIEPDGVWDIVWKSSVDSPYDVALDDDDRLIIGTGGSGKIFRVTEDPPRVVLLTRAPAEQVTGFVSGTDGATYYVTANPGKVYRLPNSRATVGTYLSEVRDTETVTTWGTVRWHATTPGDSSVHLFTRSGNTETPNSTWSLWSEAYTNPDGSRISSPKARYIQWRAELRGTADAPVLFSVTTAYLPRNLRPEITSLTVHDPGIVFQRPFSSGDPPIAGLDDEAEARAGDTGDANGESQQTTLGRRVYRKGLQTFVWTARDQNVDRLQFDLFYRSETDTTWHSLREELGAPIFTWDTTSTPDGTYVVRIVASDTPSNAPGTALTGAAESTPFDIDNSPPRITLEPVRSEADRIVVPFVVTDSHSPVNHVEYSLNTEHWQVVYPVDGIPDSREERFEVSLVSADAARLIIRATDVMNNTATAAGP